MVRTLKLLLMSLLILAVVSACSSNNNTSSSNATNASNDANEEVEAEVKEEAVEEEKPADIKGEIKVAAWNLAADTLEASIPGFNKLYPNVKVEIVRVTSSYDKIIPTLVSGVGAPDVMQIAQRDFANFLMKFPDQFANFSGQLNQDEFAGSAWGATLLNGEPHAVPWDVGPMGVWYRKDMFEQAGIKAEDIKTWDDYIEAGKLLQSKVGNDVKFVAFDLTGTAGWIDIYGILLNQQSGQLYDKDGNIDLTNEPSIKAMEMIKRMKDEGIVLNAPAWNDKITAVVNNSTATILYPVWYAGTIAANAADQKGKWGAMQLPAFTEGGPYQANLGGSLLAVSDKSENKEAAMAFAKYAMVTVEGQDVQMNAGIFPAWFPYYETENFKKVDEFFGFSYSEFFGKHSDKIPALDYGAYFTDISPPLQEAYAAILNQNKDIEEALKEAEVKVSKNTDLKIAE